MQIVKVIYLGYNKNQNKIIDNYKIENRRDNTFNYIIRLELFDNDIVDIIFEKGFTEMEIDYLEKNAYKKDEANNLFIETSCPFYYFFSKNYDKELKTMTAYLQFNRTISYEDLTELKNYIISIKNKYIRLVPYDFILDIIEKLLEITDKIIKELKFYIILS